MDKFATNDFKIAVSRFRDAMHQEGKLSQPPAFDLLLKRERHANGLRLRWAVAAVALLVLGAIPVYQNEQQRQREAAQEALDNLLLQQVSDGLSRSVSRAMAPLMGTR